MIIVFSTGTIYLPIFFEEAVAVPYSQDVVDSEEVAAVPFSQEIVVDYEEAATDGSRGKPDTDTEPGAFRTCLL